MSDPTRVIAIDVDLGRFTAVHSTRGVLADNHRKGLFPTKFTDALYDVDVLLLEVAGPVMHHAESHSHRRWMIYNALWIGYLLGGIPEHSTLGHDSCFVCPSTIWTKGYDEKSRQAIAGLPGVAKKADHDVRECLTMIDFYRKDPSVWVPLDQYMLSLCPKAK